MSIRNAYKVFDSKQEKPWIVEKYYVRLPIA